VTGYWNYTYILLFVRGIRKMKKDEFAVFSSFLLLFVLFVRFRTKVRWLNFFVVNVPAVYDGLAARDTEPDHDTIAHFISSQAEAVKGLFAQVLLKCYALGLIGGELFAIDGCKLPSNAAKEWSGTLRGDHTGSTVPQTGRTF
jgi:hypothetical protein